MCVSDISVQEVEQGRIVVANHEGNFLLRSLTKLEQTVEALSAEVAVERKGRTALSEGLVALSDGLQAERQDRIAFEKKRQNHTKSLRSYIVELFSRAACEPKSNIGTKMSFATQITPRMAAM